MELGLCCAGGAAADEHCVSGPALVILCWCRAGERKAVGAGGGCSSGHPALPKMCLQMQRRQFISCKLSSL